MLNVNVKTNGRRFSIPVPYMILNIGVSILTSKVLIKWVNKRSKPHLEEKNVSFVIPAIDKKPLKKVLRELKKYKGFELVQVKAKDGTEVIIKL